jgi:hypothetical protein
MNNQEGSNCLESSTQPTGEFGGLLETLDFKAMNG